MMTFEAALNLTFDAAFVREGPLAWIARNSSKPGRPRGDESWVLHATPEWSSAHLDDPPRAVELALLDGFANAVNHPVPWPRHIAAHRWRFSLPEEPLAAQCVADPEHGLFACGDWCGGPRVEGAVMSGLAAADEVAAWLAPGGDVARGASGVQTAREASTNVG
jgi:predicted NAD/FAD-dependent oxidoreductase